MTYTITFLILLAVLLLYIVIGPYVVDADANPFADGWNRDPPFWKRITAHG